MPLFVCCCVGLARCHVGIAVRDTMSAGPGSRRCFELFGYDFMVSAIMGHSVFFPLPQGSLIFLPCHPFPLVLVLFDAMDLQMLGFLASA